MKLTTATITLAFVALTSAQYDVESKDFRLVLSSKDSTVNGQTLSACHTGAAIESLCLSGKPSTSKPDPIAAATFRFNTSSNVETPSDGDVPGILTYKLNATPPIPSSLEFFYDPITNYALPLLFPGQGADTQTLAFDSKNLLNKQGYVNYKTSPPTAGNTTAYYRWYACQTYFSGYQYVNLVWALGEGKPETPGCAKVDVKRVFI
ncbi:uncharacterized protein N0V89_000049 [Didymosphaeria variabile]|uniref:DUF7907 domain-containing protein n=1 Tax=Didymosphaeria variabile TaxID=1932322 RepID=A0A9W9CFI6_9PLEO|nr:uncharacterized protein N0V89_000049 [Didymosphaeria variabile]KAJ4359495.1 hypothetical protein N0V89_000049 [Didymosphaeria variabile]